jgi:hypothetical protein
VTEDELTTVSLMRQSKRVLAQTIQAQARLQELLHREKALVELRVAEYESAICWDTTCLGCSKHMDTVYELDLRNTQIRRVLAFMAEVDAEPCEPCLKYVPRTVRKMLTEIHESREAPDGADGQAVAAGADGSPQGP